MICSVKEARTAQVIGQRIKIRRKWHLERIAIMEKILRMKFRNRKLARLLRETGDKKLIHYSHKHDTFWSKCTCSIHTQMGINLIGEMLMKIRDELKQK